MFFELILGEMSDMTGYLIPQLSPKREKDSLYNSRNTTHVASISGIYLNYRKHLHKKRIQLLQDWFGTPAWPPFHCFGTPIWPPWRRVKTLYHVSPSARHTRGHFCLSRVSLGLRKKRGCTWSINKTKDMYCIVSLAAGCEGDHVLQGWAPFDTSQWLIGLPCLNKHDFDFDVIVPVFCNLKMPFSSTTMHFL